jgi:hypothetical protein
VRITLFIMGTDHSLQCGQSNWSQDSILAFDTEVRRLCADHGIKCIAEEMTSAALKERGVTQTRGRRIARKLAINHHYVDLSPKARSRLFIRDPRVNACLSNVGLPDTGKDAYCDLVQGIRERLWVVRLIEEREWPALFICGANHSTAVQRIWQELGLEAEIAHADYDPTPLPS